MKCFIAATQRQSICGGLPDCIYWATAAVKVNSHEVIKIHVARPGVKNARVIMEVTKDGIRQICDGRVVAVKRLVRKSGGYEE